MEFGGELGEGVGGVGGEGEEEGRAGVVGGGPYPTLAGWRGVISNIPRPWNFLSTRRFKLISCAVGYLDCLVALPANVCRYCTRVPSRNSTHSDMKTGVKAGHVVAGSSSCAYGATCGRSVCLYCRGVARPSDDLRVTPVI